MKLPLWFKDRDGKWYNFPYDTLTPDQNGIPSIDAWGAMNHPAWAPFKDSISIRQYFDYHPAQDRWLLREKYPMKIPIWAKDREGNWEIFPYHLIETFSDGKQGVSDHQCFLGLWPGSLSTKWCHLFTHDAAHHRSLLKKQFTNE